MYGYGVVTEFLSILSWLILNFYSFNEVLLVTCKWAAFSVHVSFLKICEKITF